MPTVQDVANKFEKFDPDQKALELLEYKEDLAKNTVYMPPRVKRKLEWKQKLILNEGVVAAEKDSENGWIEEEENEENELPKKKKQKNGAKVKENKKEVEETPKKVKTAKKQRMSLANVETAAEKTAKNLMKDWIKKGKEAEVSTPKTKKAAQNGDSEELSTPKSKALVLNPFAAASTSKKKQPKEKLKGKGLLSQMKTPTNNHKTNNTFDSSEKRVKIALNKNMVQEKHEYIEAVKNSPVPYDSSKKPTKGLLKPNLLPSPINPFYRKRIGLKFNDTL